MEENSYRETVFLSGLLQKPDFTTSREWVEHQTMQYDFLTKRGLQSDTCFLDLGCGPMRLGARVIPIVIDGWYYGVDINADTLALGEEVLTSFGVATSNYTLTATSDFDLEAIKRPINIAFSNSLFSHLTMNSIARALTRLRQKIEKNGVYYSTFFLIPDDWDRTQAFPRKKWERDFFTYDVRDPFHYSLSDMRWVASVCGFSLEIDHEFGHPTQTMGVFRPQ